MSISVTVVVHGSVSVSMDDLIASLQQQRDEIKRCGGPPRCACGQPMGTCGSHKAPTSTAAPAAHSAGAGGGDAGGAGAGAGGGDAGGAGDA